MKRKKIIFLSHSSKLAGAERSLLTIAELMNKGEYESMVVCPDKGALVERVVGRNVPYRVSPMLKWVYPSAMVDRIMKLSPLSELMIKLQEEKLYQVIEDFGCDVLVSNTITIRHGAEISKRAKVPPSNIHSDYAYSQIPISDDYLYVDAEYPESIST